MDVQSILELMKEMKNSDIANLKWEADGQSLQLSRQVIAIDSAMLNPLEDSGTSDSCNSVGSKVQAFVLDQSGAADLFNIVDVAKPKGRVVSSPVVGIFYAAAAPDQDPFVSIGSCVEEGAPLGIIEAMKLMNEVTSPCNGTIVDILVSSAQRVEYGQPLFVIKEAV